METFDKVNDVLVVYHVYSDEQLLWQFLEELSSMIQALVKGEAQA